MPISEQQQQQPPSSPWIREEPAREESTRAGLTWDEIVDSLLQPNILSTDEAATLMFLALYRKFALPNQLIQSLLDRFKMIKSDSLTDTVRASRILEIVQQWVSNYRNDFLGPQARLLLTKFITAVESSREWRYHLPVLTHLYEQVLSVQSDPDSGWALKESAERQEEVDEDGNNRRSFIYLLPKQIAEEIETRSASPTMESFSLDQGFIADSPPLADTLITPTRKASANTISSANLDFEDSERGYLFIRHPAEAYAQTLSQVEWRYFSRIQPRNVLQHVWAPKASTRSGPVNDMISHFNLISRWVSLTILDVPKLKQRAKVLERFMEIAVHLRYMHNFNSLYAVLAGLNSASVHRLSVTRDLAQAKTVYSSYKATEALMASDRSFAAYRECLKTSPDPKIPYLGIHMQDLLRIDHGNESFLEGGLINLWKKDLMLRVLHRIFDCQNVEYSLPPPMQDIENAIIDAPEITDEELYCKSLELEKRAKQSMSGSMFKKWIESGFS